MLNPASGHDESHVAFTPVQFGCIEIYFKNDAYDVIIVIVPVVETACKNSSGTHTTRGKLAGVRLYLSGILNPARTEWNPRHSF